MAVPNIFGSATAAIPLSQLDTNFATPVTIGNTAVQLGNTVTSFGNVTLTNVTISSGNVTITGANVSGTANVSTLVVTSNETVLGNTAVTGNITASLFTSTSTFGFKNRIINGAMVIDQRNAGASVTPAVAGYTLDRWIVDLTQASKFSVQQNAGAVTPPVGFIKYLGVTSLSAYSVLAGDYFILTQRIEGLNCTDLAWGTANAKTVTLSFQVYSSLTGTFGGVLANSGFSRTYPFSYSVPVANTWTTVSVTIAGDTSGTWLTTNGVGIAVNFSLGTGSTYSGTAGAWSGTTYTSVTGATSVVGTNGATFYITGVQLEKGSTATSFDYRPYGTELALCQRYYEKSFAQSQAPANNPTTKTGYIATFSFGTNTYTQFPTVQFKVVKQSNPTVTFYNPLSGTASRATDVNNSANTFPLTTSFGSVGSSINDQAFSVSVNNTSATNQSLSVHWTAESEL